MHTDSQPDRAARLAVAEASVDMGKANVRTVIIFASGDHALQADQVARGAQSIVPHATVIVAGGADVMAPEGETQGDTALSVLVLSSEVQVCTANVGGGSKNMGRRLGRQLATGKDEPLLLMCRSHIFDTDLVDGFHETSGSVAVFGGGIIEGARLAIARPNEEATTCAALAARFEGNIRLAVGVTPGVQLMTEYLEIEEIDEGFVTRMDGRAPLDLLGDAVEDREDRPLVLVSIAPRCEANNGRSNQSLIRGVTGVNPPKGAVHLGTEVQVGDRVAFCTPDGHAAHEDFQVMLRSLERNLGGGVPIAGFYMGCASRGSRLFARPGADARTIRAGLGEVPYAGMYSSFEIAPFDGRPRMHVYSGVLGLLYAPS